jgi:hypothetical protein
MVIPGSSQAVGSSETASTNHTTEGQELAVRNLHDHHL